MESRDNYGTWIARPDVDYGDEDIFEPPRLCSTPRPTRAAITGSDEVPATRPTTVPIIDQRMRNAYSNTRFALESVLRQLRQISASDYLATEEFENAVKTALISLDGITNQLRELNKTLWQHRRQEIDL